MEAWLVGLAVYCLWCWIAAIYTINRDRKIDDGNPLQDGTLFVFAPILAFVIIIGFIVLMTGYSVGCVIRWERPSWQGYKDCIP